MDVDEDVSTSPLRFICRSGEFQRHTSCQAPGHIQASLLILPLSATPSFFALCQRNPVSCRLLAYSKPGNPCEFINNFPGISGEEIVGNNFDIRTDAPEYHVYENGKMIGEEIEVKKCFKKDSVAFLIGCSFSIERALADAGLPPRHCTGAFSTLAWVRTVRCIRPPSLSCQQASSPIQDAWSSPWAHITPETSRKSAPSPLSSALCMVSPSHGASMQSLNSASRISPAWISVVLPNLPLRRESCRFSG